MTDMVEQVKLKLEEYNIDIFDYYKIENNDYVFIVENMVIIVHENMKDTSVSFQVSTTPEVVANNILILKEIIEIERINIMEVFAFTNEKQIVCGKKAYKLFHKSIKDDVATDIEQNRMYQNILLTSDGFEC